MQFKVPQNIDMEDPTSLATASFEGRDSLQLNGWCDKEVCAV